MKIKKGFVLEPVGGAYIAVAVGNEATNVNALIRMNSTGAFLWELLEKEQTAETLLAAMLQEEMYDELDGPIGRVAALDVPMPYNISMEKYVIPDANRIAEAVRAQLARDR